MQTNMNSGLGRHSTLCFCLAGDKVHNYLDNFLLAMNRERERERGGGGGGGKRTCHTDLCIFAYGKCMGFEQLRQRIIFCVTYTFFLLSAYLRPLNSSLFIFTELWWPPAWELCAYQSSSFFFIYFLLSCGDLHGDCTSPIKVLHYSLFIFIELW